MLHNYILRKKYFYEVLRIITMVSQILVYFFFKIQGFVTIKKGEISIFKPTYVQGRCFSPRSRGGGAMSWSFRTASGRLGVRIPAATDLRSKNR